VGSRVSTLGNQTYSAKSNVPEGRCDRSLARSAWDSANPKSRPVGYGTIRAGVRTDSTWRTFSPTVGEASPEEPERDILITTTRRYPDSSCPKIQPASSQPRFRVVHPALEVDSRHFS
jgi:hypothetical protein